MVVYDIATPKLPDGLAMAMMIQAMSAGFLIGNLQGHLLFEELRLDTMAIDCDKSVIFGDL